MYLCVEWNWSLLPMWRYSFLSAGHMDTSCYSDTPERKTDRRNPEDTLLEGKRGTNLSNRIYSLFYHE